jgi:thiol-disulfide isomerase/thioredoxin
MPLYEFKEQDEFEEFWTDDKHKKPLTGMRVKDRAFIVYHTATWCGPCKRMNIPAIVEAAEKVGLSIWKVDQDVNQYTTGFCGIRSIPTFQIMTPKKVLATLQPSSTDDVIQWVSKYAS